MKKLLAIILAMVMVLSLAACGGSSAPAAEAPAADAPAAEAPAAEAPGAEAPQVTAPTEAEAPSIPGVDDIPSPDLTEKKAVVVDDEVMEFSLEDILAEFGKDT